MPKYLFFLVIIALLSFISCSGSSTSKTTTDTDNIPQPDDTTNDIDTATPTDTDTKPEPDKDPTPTDTDTTAPDKDTVTPQPDPDTTPDEDKIPEPTLKPFTCANNVCHDPNTGLDWEEDAAEQDPWDDGTYCDKLELNNFTDWRLPAISELRTLIRGCPGMMTYDNCKFDETCATYECYDTCLESFCHKQPNKGPGVEGCYWEPNLKGKCMAYYSTTKLNNQTMYIRFEAATIGGGVDTPTHKRCVRGTRTDKP